MKEYKGLIVPNISTHESAWGRQTEICYNRYDNTNGCKDISCRQCIYCSENINEYIEWEKENIGG